jgi:hypothetical protein
MINKQSIKPINLTNELGALLLLVAFQVMIVILINSGYLKGGAIESLFVKHIPTDPIYFDVFLLFALNTSLIMKGIKQKAPWRIVSSSLIVGGIFGAIFGFAFALSESSPVLHYFISAIMWGGTMAVLSSIYVVISYSFYLLMKRVFNSLL